MSCLFDALAHALSARVGLLRHARYEAIRNMSVPVTGASLRAALCDVMPSVRVHGATLAEWGAMETGSDSNAYTRAMRGDGTWGGGVEIAALSAMLRAPIFVRGAARVSFGREFKDAKPLRLHYTGSHYTPMR